MSDVVVQKKKNRMWNIEALRLLAMLMVVSLHYLAKGQLLAPLSQTLDAQGYVSWILETLSITAVNVYVLISGYFLVGSGLRCKRLISLLAQVLFYTCLIPLVLLLGGVIHLSDLTLWNILLYIFPVNMLHYWFVSAYVIMFLFVPVLNAAVHIMTRKQLKYIIILLLILEGGCKSVLPVRLELDNLGYDALWFMVVYLIAAYIRLHGISFFTERADTAKKAGCVYLLLCAAMFGWTMLLHFVYLQTGQLQNFMESAYGYNHLLNIAAAVALFYTFMHMGKGEQKDTAWKRLLVRVSPFSFGVYLFHEHVDIRYVWPFKMGAGLVDGAFSLIGHWAVAVLTILVLGLLLDFCRNLLFAPVEKVLAGTRLAQKLSRVDDCVNGRSGKE